MSAKILSSHEFFLSTAALKAPSSTIPELESTSTSKGQASQTSKPRVLGDQNHGGQTQSTDSLAKPRVSKYSRTSGESIFSSSIAKVMTPVSRSSNWLKSACILSTWDFLLAKMDCTTVAWSFCALSIAD